MLKLQSHGYYDATRKIQKRSGKSVIPVLESKLHQFLEKCDEIENEFTNLETLKGKLFTFDGLEISLDWTDLPPSKKDNVKKDYELLQDKIEKYFIENEIKSDLKKECPRHWERHGDLILFPEESFVSAVWDTLGVQFWHDVADVLRVNRLAKKWTVSRDGFRTPQVKLLLGDNGWVQHKDNGISYRYDITRCMFSAGNITEKLRVAKMDCSGETVVDLYAGIGYFTLPYLVHAGAATVHACEWNPDAVIALRQNLKLNRVEERCIVHVGDNRKVCPRNIADRVNLGLIPSSTFGWPVACAALKNDHGGVLHIHSNVTTKPTKCSESTFGAPRVTKPGEGMEGRPRCPTSEKTFAQLDTAADESFGSSSKRIVQSQSQIETKTFHAHNFESSERLSVHEESKMGDPKFENESSLNSCVDQSLVETEKLKTESFEFPKGNKDFGREMCADFENTCKSSKNSQMIQTEECKMCPDSFDVSKVVEDAGTETRGDFQNRISKNAMHSLQRPRMTKIENISNQDYEVSKSLSQDLHDVGGTRENFQSTRQSPEEKLKLHGSEMENCQTTRNQVSKIFGQITQTSSSSHAQEKLQLSESEPREGLNSERRRFRGSDIGELDNDSFQDVLEVWDNLVLSNQECWTKWAELVSGIIQTILHRVHGEAWAVEVLHIEHVKSYAPHVDHLVLDLSCRPRRPMKIDH